jgi:hypothetical protein
VRPIAELYKKMGNRYRQTKKMMETSILSKTDRSMGYFLKQQKTTKKKNNINKNNRTTKKCRR